MTHDNIEIRPVRDTDLEALRTLEQSSFDSDRLSRRRMRHWIHASNRAFVVAEVVEGAERAKEAGNIVGYGLVLFHGATRLARLYSIAVASEAQGRGVGKRLLQALEEAAAARGRLFMRLEVAPDNKAAIRLYESAGYVAFGTYEDYYEDHRDALRMQKLIRYAPEPRRGYDIPWYQQTTGFTCGPASLMMAMAGLDRKVKPARELELDIWREATTIFMTSRAAASVTSARTRGCCMMPRR